MKRTVDKSFQGHATTLEHYGLYSPIGVQVLFCAPRVYAHSPLHALIVPTALNFSATVGS